MEIKDILRVKEALGVAVSWSTNQRRAASPRRQRGSASASIIMAVVHHPLPPTVLQEGRDFDPLHSMFYTHCQGPCLTYRDAQ